MKFTVGIQGYVWQQIYESRGQKLEDDFDEALSSIAASGIEAFEIGLPTDEIAQRLGQSLAKNNLKMPSMYAGATLYTAEWRQGVDQILERARRGKALGATIVVVNPNPIQWGKPLNKSDDELKRQAQALQLLGEKLIPEEMTLAYHTHDAEMRCAAREFHHMMQGTDPKVVGMCLDTHWIYRGADNSQVAMYDVLQMYLPRLKTLHLRQSMNGIWSEVLSDGDIDYRPLAVQLNKIAFTGPITVEQCFEAGTPRTMPPQEAQRRSRQWVRDVFGA